MTSQIDGDLQQESQAQAPVPASRGARWLETGVQVFLFVLAVVTALDSLKLGMTVSFGPGPGFFPFFLSIGMAVLVLVWMFQSYRERRGSGAVASEEAVDLRHVVSVMVSLVLLAAVMGFLGYQIAMFLFLLYHLLFRARRRWYTALVIALAGSVGVFHIFSDVLAVPLPVSVFAPLNLIGL